MLFDWLPFKTGLTFMQSLIQSDAKKADTHLLLYTVTNVYPFFCIRLYVVAPKQNTKYHMFVRLFSMMNSVLPVQYNLILELVEVSKPKMYLQLVFHSQKGGYLGGCLKTYKIYGVRIIVGTLYVFTRCYPSFFLNVIELFSIFS